MAHPTRGSLLYAVGWFIFSFAIWLWFVDSTVLAELLLGLTVAALATALALAVRSFSPFSFRPRLRWVSLLKGAPIGILRDSGFLALVLWRRLILGKKPRSTFRMVPFSRVDDDPESAALRALAIAGTSITPNTLVIGIDQERKAALVHQLAPESREKLRQRVVGADPA